MTAHREIVSIRPRALAEEGAALYMGMSVSTLQKLVREKRIPRPRQVSDRLVAHEVADLDDYMDNCPRSDLPPGPGRKSA